MHSAHPLAAFCTLCSPAYSPYPMCSAHPLARLSLQPPKWSISTPLPSRLFGSASSHPCSPSSHCTPLRFAHPLACRTLHMLSPACSLSSPSGHLLQAVPVANWCVKLSCGKLEAESWQQQIGHGKLSHSGVAYMFNLNSIATSWLHIWTLLRSDSISMVFFSIRLQICSCKCHGIVWQIFLIFAMA